MLSALPFWKASTINFFAAFSGFSMGFIKATASWKHFIQLLWWLFNNEESTHQGMSKRNTNLTNLIWNNVPKTITGNNKEFKRTFNHFLLHFKYKKCKEFFCSKDILSGFAFFYLTVDAHNLWGNVNTVERSQWIYLKINPKNLGKERFPTYPNVKKSYPRKIRLCMILKVLVKFPWGDMNIVSKSILILMFNLLRFL